MVTRSSGRKFDEMREVVIKPHTNPYAEGSCLIKFGNTAVICTASFEEGVPQFLRNTGKGWLTAEYGMLPRSTHFRTRREINMAKPSGRNMEIQRLIGRTLRSTLDLSKIGERQLIIDCDVIQADGGTRTASITGGYVAMVLAIEKLVRNKVIKNNPIINQIAAVSCGVINGQAILDLEYTEDSSAQVDANFVMTADGRISEIQSSAEVTPFSVEQFNAMLELSRLGIKKLINLQLEALQKAIA